MSAVLEYATTEGGCYLPPSGTRAHARLIQTQDHFTARSNVFVLVTDTNSVNISQTYVSPQFLQIHSLVKRRLLAALSVIVEQDDDGYIAQTVDLPLYGFAESAPEAVEMLKAEIESLYEDLMDDDNFSHDFLMKKKLLTAIVAE